MTAHGNPCERKAGWGRDAFSGPCKHHAAGRKRADDGDEVPDPPPGLSGQSRATWRALLSEWVLSAEERLTLQGSLESWDLYRTTRAKVEREGAVVETDGGGVKRNPAALVARDALRDYRAGVRELGISSQVEE